MEPQQDTNSIEITFDDEGNERIRSSNASSTSSSTSSSEFQDPQLNSFKKGENLQKRSSNEDQGKKDEQEKEPQNGNGSTVQSPPIQTMERPPDNGSGYRIPSYVFARNNTGSNQVEWSTTSNESLFSIHTGNTSFTGDKYSWLLEAADMYNIPDEEDSPKTQEIPTPQVSSLESPSSPNDEVVIIVPEKEMENVNTSDGTKTKPFTVEDQATPASSRSNESAHSFAFAFPLCRAEDRGESVKSVKSVKSSGLSSVPEQQKESSSSLESSGEQNPSPEPEPAKNSLVFSCFASCMACFTRCSKASTDKDSAFKD